MDSSAPSAASSDCHLCIFVHGLWGSPKHLYNLSNALREAHKDGSLHILVVTRNAGNYTYDGIETGAERVTREIEDEIEDLEKNGKKVTKFSMIGYSLGGLVARYAAGLLYSKGLFDTVQPVNFTTFASPHLGTRTPMLGWQSNVFNALGARTLSSSGSQLWCIDKFRDTGRPLLAVLADPSSIFMRALACFKLRSLYANITNDRAVPFYTAYISKIDPFADLTTVDIHYDPKYENVILDTDCLATPRTTAASWQDRANAVLGQVPFYLTVSLLAPVGALVFLANAGVQSMQSATRIKQHEDGSAGLDTKPYRIPLMFQEMQHKAELALERLNTADREDYLPEKEEDKQRSADDTENSETGGDSSENLSSTTTLRSPETAEAQLQPDKADTIADASNHSGFRTLALTDEQFAMKKHLDALGFDKYAVHIQKAGHSHAAIIIRYNRFGFDDGKVVLKHWLERFES